MNYNGKTIETSNLTNKNEIILSGSISKLTNYCSNLKIANADIINIYKSNLQAKWIIENQVFKRLLILFNGSNSDIKYIKIKLLVKDELKILSLIEALNISLLEAIYMLYIQDKEVEWVAYDT